MVKKRTDSTPAVNNRVIVGVVINKIRETVLKECTSTHTIECNINNNAAVSDVPSPSCYYKHEVNLKCNILDLGQYHWAFTSKNQLAKLNINDITKKCGDLKLFMAHQKQHTGFIHISHIRDCSRSHVDKQWLQKLIRLYHYVKSFLGPGFKSISTLT